MKLTEIKCKYCQTVALMKKPNAKFCSDNCRKQYWAKHVEPRALCEDCGTILGINSLRNVRQGKQNSLCQSCAMYRQVGTGRDF